MFDVTIVSNRDSQQIAAGSFACGYRQVSACGRIADEDAVLGYCADLEAHGFSRRAELLLGEFCLYGYVFVEMH
jgi:hypothetical protein